VSRTVSSRFPDFALAEDALVRLERQVALLDSLIVGSAEDTAPALDAFGLPDPARAACEEQLAQGGYLLVVRVADQSEAELVFDLLDAMASERAAAAEQPAPEPAVAEAPQAPAEAEPAAEEALPVAGEELRVGSPSVVRGGARVRSWPAEAPAAADLPLADEQAPVERRLSAEQIEQAGLLKPRVIELTEMREKPVVSKHAFVREELVVRKSAQERVEHFEDKVRHTEVEVEELPAEERSAFPDFGGEDAAGPGRTG
jgi:uncharacterized protein (TIGR02271 family)